MFIIEHKEFVNINNISNIRYKNQTTFEYLFNDIKNLSQLKYRIKKISENYLGYYYKDAEKFKGDLFEIFAECYFKLLGSCPTICVSGYVPNPSNDDYGVDAFGFGVENKHCTIQVKFRSDPKIDLLQSDLNQFPFQSIVLHDVDKNSTNSIIVFTTAKKLHWVTDTRVFLGRVKTIGYDEIRLKIDNCSSFWTNLNALVKFTLKTRYGTP